MEFIRIPYHWQDRDLLTVEQFCELTQVSRDDVRDWRRRRVGPQWVRLECGARCCITVGEARGFVAVGLDPDECGRD